MLRDFRSAPVEPPLRAALAYLEKLTREPDAVGPDDIAALRAAGLSDDHIEDAAAVCALFNTYVRLADTFAFAIPPDEGFAQSASMLLRVGYDFPPPLKLLLRERRR